VTIEQMGSIGELIAAIATVSTLLYLATQIRQASSSSRSASAVAESQSEASLSILLAQDPDLNRIFYDGLADPTSLTERDRLRLGAFINAFLADIEQAWRLHKEGSLDDDQWRARMSFIRWLTHQPGFIDYWATWHSTAPSEFAKVLDNASRSESAVPIELSRAQQSAAADSA
jgi:hypothetical protein